VLGTAKNAIVVWIGIVFLGETVTTLQGGGYALSLAGFFLYNYLKMQQPAGVCGLRQSSPLPTSSCTAAKTEHSAVRLPSGCITGRICEVQSSRAAAAQNSEEQSPISSPTTRVARQISMFP